MSDKNKNIENDDDSEYTTLDSSKEDWRVAQEEFYGEYPNYLGIGSCEYKLKIFLELTFEMLLNFSPALLNYAE